MNLVSKITNNCNKNTNGNNHNFNIANNVSLRKSCGNFITEPNDTIINSNFNLRDSNNNLSKKCKEISIEYDNFKNNENDYYQSKYNISEKNEGSISVKNSRIKKGLITGYAKGYTNFNTNFNQNMTSSNTPSNNNDDKENSNIYKNKIDKSKSKTKSELNKNGPQIKSNCLKYKSNYNQNENQIINDSKNLEYDQNKNDLEENIQQTTCEVYVFNKENIPEEEIINDSENIINQIALNANFYKKTLEENRKIMDSEHDIIADSLYDLAVHFLTFKNELLNSIKPTIINNHINMNVTNFNQENNNMFSNSGIKQINNNGNNSNIIPINEINHNFDLNKNLFNENLEKK